MANKAPPPTGDGFLVSTSLDREGVSIFPAINPDAFRAPGCGGGGGISRAESGQPDAGFHRGGGRTLVDRGLYAICGRHLTRIIIYLRSSDASHLRQSKHLEGLWTKQRSGHPGEGRANCLAKLNAVKRNVWTLPVCKKKRKPQNVRPGVQHGKRRDLVVLRVEPTIYPPSRRPSKHGHNLIQPMYSLGAHRPSSTKRRRRRRKYRTHPSVPREGPEDSAPRVAFSLATPLA